MKKNLKANKMCKCCIDKICNCLKAINKINEKALLVLIIAIFAIVGGLFGYSMGIADQADKIAAIEKMPLKKQPSRQVLGEKINNSYVNPLYTVDTKKIQFPIAQLKGCRNWNECRTFCSYPENFQTCVAWLKTQKTQ